VGQALDLGAVNDDYFDPVLERCRDFEMGVGKLGGRTSDALSRDEEPEVESAILQPPDEIRYRDC
jgi:hypothetical protein